jgi:hypothetical protein
MKIIAVTLAHLLVAAFAVSAAEDRREKVLKDRTEVQSIPQWIYNDLSKGVAEATRSGKPMLIVLRCIP